MPGFDVLVRGTGRQVVGFDGGHPGVEVLAAACGEDGGELAHPFGQGDRKDGHASVHVARQYLGSVGKTDNGSVVVSTLWADERMYYPLHVAAYTPAGRLPAGLHDPGFATKPQLAAGLIGRAIAAGIPFAAVVADSFYGPDGTDTVIGELARARLPYVLAPTTPAARATRRRHHRPGNQPPPPLTNHR